MGKGEGESFNYHMSAVSCGDDTVSNGLRSTLYVPSIPSTFCSTFLPVHHLGNIRVMEQIEYNLRHTLKRSASLAQASSSAVLSGVVRPVKFPHKTCF